MYATSDPVAVDGFILKSHANVFCGYSAGDVMRFRTPNFSPEPTASSLPFAEVLEDSLLPGFGGAQSPAAAAQCHVGLHCDGGHNSLKA